MISLSSINALENFDTVDDNAIDLLIFEVIHLLKDKVKITVDSVFESNSERPQDVNIGVRACPQNRELRRQGYEVFLMYKKKPIYELHFAVNKQLLCVRKPFNIDFETIKKQNVFKSFPVELDDKSKMKIFERTSISIERAEHPEVKNVVETIFIGDESQSDMLCAPGIYPRYQPLTNYSGDEGEQCDFQNEDSAVRAAEFDRPNMMALILQRAAWGMNIACAFLDTKQNKLYIAESENFDHPEALALRKHNPSGCYELYLYNDDRAFESLYEEETAQQLLTFSNFGRSCDWILMPFDKWFGSLFETVSKIQNN